MSGVTVQKIAEPLATTTPLFREIDELFEAVRQRTFEMFLDRGNTEGQDVRDWLDAERELLWSPPAELVEKKNEFQLRIAVPGFEAGEIDVSALPDAIIVGAGAKKETTKKDGDVHIAELSSRKVFRRVDLPHPTDVEKATATLANGILQLTVPKAATPTEKKVAVAAHTGK